jgi:hypothetical protein
MIWRIFCIFAAELIVTYYLIDINDESKENFKVPPPDNGKQQP